ncbi:hypothetical protein PQO01_08945 [Lentisphaera marina]|uniref:hypothetical protein n=1 Tax=Lentisphaera marina TaxID=1111041 RepID=UPI0023670A56|nr:hypothetical protein [Lentisphaera marina]MDD7985073.1 hypothetical protein [Lentisphaera marina]
MSLRLSLNLSKAYFLGCAPVPTICSKGVISEWLGKGLLKDSFPFEQRSKRLLKAWEAVGHPAYERSPRRQILSQECFDFLRNPNLQSQQTRTHRKLIRKLVQRKVAKLET